MQGREIRRRIDNDRISNLPDDVLCHILSFLPTKLAAATTVLSKRWTPLWLKLPVLHFNENDARSNLTRLVYAAMLDSRYDVTPQQPLKAFTLRCLQHYSKCDPCDIMAWIKAATKRGVHHFNIHLNKTIKLPSSVFFHAASSLVVLKLSELTLLNTNSSSSNVCFPSLKILHLESVCFGKHEHLTHLLSASPNLEELFLYYPTVVEGGALITHNGGQESNTGQELPTFPNLIRAYVSENCIPLECFYKVKSLSMYERFSSYNITCTLSNLTSLKLNVMIYDWDRFIKVLQHCPKLQRFAIVKIPNSKHDSDDKDWVLSKVVPECLTSHLVTCTLREFQGWEHELQFANYIMQNAKVLRTMRIISPTSSYTLAKHEMLKKLSLCTRSSITCRLLFE